MHAFAEIEEPYGWTNVEWKPADLLRALTDADSGDLTLASDLCDAMVADDRVRGVLQTRVMAILGLNGDATLSFDCPSVRMRKAIERDWYASAPEAELSKLIRRALLLGLSVAQREVVEHDGRWIPRIVPWDTRNVQFDWTRRKYITHDAAWKEQLIEGDQWVMMLPYGKSRPWAEGAWRAVAIYWLAKYHSIRNWARHNDLHGSGMVVGHLPEGTPTKSDGAKKFWTDLKALARNARIVLPAGYTLEILEAQARTWETFPKLIEKADTGIAIVLLGQPLTTEVPDAIRTGATAASGVRQDYLEFDVQWLSTWAHDVHLPAWVSWNFGVGVEPPWLIYQTDPPLDLELIARTMGTLADSIMKLQSVTPKGYELDTAVLFEQWKIPVKKAQNVDSTVPGPQDQ